jgi:hypothetical protein
MPFKNNIILKICIQVSVELFIYLVYLRVELLDHMVTMFRLIFLVGLDLNSELHACKASSLLIDPYLQTIFALVIFGNGLL